MSYRPDTPREMSMKRLIDTIFDLERGTRVAERKSNDRLLADLRARRFELLDELNRRLR